MVSQLDLLAGVEKTEPPGPIADAAFAAWNEYAKRFGWVTASHNRHGRPNQLKRAVKELGGLHQWRALLEKCGTSDFLCGRSNTPGRKPFSFSLDWCLKPANLTKIEDGNYFHAAVRGAAPTETFSQRLRTASGTDWDARLARYKPGGFWHVDAEGPRPENNGKHLAPAEKIAAWRAKHGIGERREETREERIAGMIASYRRHGRHADANRLEEELAALQGRPPELIAAPDARDPDVVPGNNGVKTGYKPSPPRSEAEITRQMAARENATDVDYSWAMDRDGDYEDE